MVGGVLRDAYSADVAININEFVSLGQIKKEPCYPMIGRRKKRTLVKYLVPKSRAKDGEADRTDWQTESIFQEVGGLKT